MHKRVQLVANLALIALVPIAGVEAFRPGTLAEAGSILINFGGSAGAGVPPQPVATDTERSIPVPLEPIPVAGAPVLGDTNADVVLIEYSDFECPFCAEFYRETLPVLIREYVDAGKVSLVFRHLPLSRLHPNATRAAQAAVCAGSQGRFWEMHDTLFENQLFLDSGSLVEYAARLGLDLAEFRACLATEGPATVASDTDEAERLGLVSTPVFFVGVRSSEGYVQVLETIPGAKTADRFRQALDRALGHETIR